MEQGMSASPWVAEAYDNLKVVLDSGVMSGYRASGDGHLGGPFVRTLEEWFCDYLPVKHAVAVSSATAALHTALLACGLNNKFVGTTPMSFSASTSCILMAKSIPEFIDVDPDTFNSDDIYEFTRTVRGIVAVHLMGNPLDIDGIMTLAKQNRLRLIEDASQALGATYKGRKVGTFGDCGIFSFNQSKSVTSGEGGMLVTNDDEIARKARLIRNHGETQADILGYNYRMTELQAAVILPQLKLLDCMNAYRRELASYLSKRLAQIPGIVPPVVRPDCEHTFYTYAVKVDPEIYDRNSLQAKLNETGIYFGSPSYGMPIYLLPGYEHLGLGLGTCPVAEDLWANRLMVTDTVRYPTTKKDLDRWVEVFKQVIRDG